MVIVAGAEISAIALVESEKVSRSSRMLPLGLLFPDTVPVPSKRTPANVVAADVSAVELTVSCGPMELTISSFVMPTSE